METKLKKFAFYLVFIFFLCASTAFGKTYYIDTSGSDSRGDGSQERPWHSISYALKNVHSGDTISLNNGTFIEGQMSVPPGVSLTSTSKDKSRVTIRPNVNLSKYTPWIRLDTASPGGNGNQIISHISFYGINGGNRVTFAIRVQNRNNVKIHNCDFTDFREAVFDPAAGGVPTIQVESTEIGWVKWANYWPADPGPPGDDNAIDRLWPDPATFVSNFEFSHNTMRSCFAVKPYLLKDSSFHNNYIDNSETSEWCLRGTPSFLDNVDIHNNTFLACTMGYDDSGPSGHNAIFPVELWLWKGGCQFYNNVSNGFFSLSYGKETKIYRNSSHPIDGTDTPIRGIGIEAIGQSYCEIYENYIGNGQHSGIVVGLEQATANNDRILNKVTVRNNVIVDADFGGITLSQVSRNNRNTVVRNVYIHNNVVYGPQLDYGMKIEVDNNGGAALLENAYVKNNIFMNTSQTAGKSEGDGSVKNLEIDHNLFYGCKENSWFYAADWKGPKGQTETIIANPLFKGPTTDYKGFTLSTGSPAIDSGVDVGFVYSGSAPDRGAIETGLQSKERDSVPLNPPSIRISSH